GRVAKRCGRPLLGPGWVAGVRPAERRYSLVAPHYRSVMDYSPEGLADAAAAYRRLEGFVERAGELAGPVQPARTVCAEFVAALDDDLGTPAALAAVHDVVREGNSALAAGNRAAVAGALGRVRAMRGVLGLDPLAAPWVDRGGGRGVRELVDRLVSVALEQRQGARARKDYAEADAIRDQLAAAGVLVEDTPQGPRWSLD